MLKRIGHIIIILLLLCGTTGFTITRHYCGGRLMHASLFSTPGNCCKEDCNCCHNEKIKIHITDQFETSTFRTDFKAGFKTLLENHSLPTLLAFASSFTTPFINGTTGDRFIKPYPAKQIYAGPSSAFLQVFLV